MKFINKHSSCILLAASLLLTNQTYAVESADAALVSVKPAREEKVSPSVWLAGNVVNRKSVRLSAEQSGKLIWILDVGAAVKAEQAVARLDDRELTLRAAEKHAEMRRQSANIDYLAKQQQRLSQLLTNNSTAKSELDRVDRDLTVAKEELAALDIQIKQIELAIEKTTIRAPFAGKVNQRLAQQGEYVNAGAALVQLIDPVSLDISVAAPLSLAPYLTQQAEVLVKWNEQLRTIPVRTWSPAGDQLSRTFDVRLDASHLDLLGGDGVSVSMPSAKEANAILVPRDALMLRERDIYVVTIDPEQTAKRVSVKVGRGLGDWVSIEGSVSAGDQVVVRGGERLQDGQKVRLMPQPLNDSESIAAY